jgi:hypothetical protein
MFRRAITLLVTIPFLAILTGGCEDDEKATPQIIFDGNIQRGEVDPGYQSCPDVGALFTIGDFGNQNVDPKIPSKAVKDGESFAQGTVSVSCSVTPAGPDEFNVVGSIDLSGATGGFFRIDGKFKTQGDQTGIHAKFASRRSANTYDQIDRACIVRYTTTFQGVAAGRVWGEIDCPKAKNEGAQTQCQTQAQFRFENCDGS